MIMLYSLFILAKANAFAIRKMHLFAEKGPFELVSKNEGLLELATGLEPATC